MATLSKDEMKNVLHEIIEAYTKWQEINELARPEDKVFLHPPATEPALAALQSVAPFKLPPSYVQLLSLYDGIDNFFGFNGNIVSSAYRFDRNREWKDCLDLSQVMLFAFDEDGTALFFDGTTQTPDGELGVIEIGNYRERHTYASLSDYLVDRAELMRTWLKQGRQ
jgi:hypothetical protein